MQTEAIKRRTLAAGTSSFRRGAGRGARGVMRAGEGIYGGQDMRMQRVIMSAAIAAATAMAAHAGAGQLSTFEGDVDPLHTPNPGQGTNRFDEATAYKWGDSFDANLVD